MNPSEEKSKLFEQFKKAIQDCQLVDSSDEYLEKWMIARNYNVKAAEKMLRQSLEWRRMNRVDDILTNWTPPEVIAKYYSMGQTGTDKFGCPLWISAQGRIDLKGILQTAGKRELMRYQIYVMEKSGKEMRLNRQLCPSMKICCISDMEHLSMKQLTYKPGVDFGLEQTKIYEANYPENIRRIFIINAPKLYTVLYNVLKPVLPQATVEKVRMFGSDRKEWTAALLEEIDADQLPALYGGNLTDPDGDPKCPSLFNMGGEVPRSYYSNIAKPVAKEGMKSLDVAARSKEKLEFEISDDNSILRWEFMTESGDISYRVFCNTSSGLNNLIPLERVESDVFMEEGQVLCDGAGKYTFEFDNSFSLIRSKKVHYSISVDKSSSF